VDEQARKEHQFDYSASAIIKLRNLSAKVQRFAGLVNDIIALCGFFAANIVF